MTLWILIALGVLLLVWFLYITGSGGDHDRGPKTRLGRAWRRIVLWGGDVRKIGHFPWVTWDVSEHLVEYEEAVSALPFIRPGDVGLHRERGFLSNLAIPGFMKHAWLHMNGPQRFGIPGGKQLCDTGAMEMVEAVSEGVLRRSALHPIRSDYTIILRPKDVSPASVRWALEKSRRIVGCQYDTDFRFDIEEELTHFQSDAVPSEADFARRRAEMEAFLDNLRAEWDGGFSCSEAVSFAWWHEQKKLNLYRQPMRGKQVIPPDAFLNRGFEIVWMSESVTPELAAKLGLGEEGVQMICEHRDRRRAAAEAELGLEPGAAPARRGRLWRRIGRRLGIRRNRRPSGGQGA
ncbi:MAG TPA: hypothetical protein PK280_17730 [Planctomycetota bacterium]|nr:hypothetical protein [Planctomycetota bacterium]